MMDWWICGTIAILALDMVDWRYMERYDDMVDMWKYLVLLAPDLQHLPIFSPKLRKQITGNVSENVLFGD